MTLKDYTDGKIKNEDLVFEWTIEKTRNFHNGYSYIPSYTVPDLTKSLKEWVNHIHEKYGDFSSNKYKESDEFKMIMNLKNHIRKIHDSIGLTIDKEDKVFSSLKSLQEWFNKNGFCVNAEKTYINSNNH